jgi:hypothetical protein
VARDDGTIVPVTHFVEVLARPTIEPDRWGAGAGETDAAGEAMNLDAAREIWEAAHLEYRSLASPLNSSRKAFFATSRGRSASEAKADEGRYDSLLQV